MFQTLDRLEKLLEIASKEGIKVRCEWLGGVCGGLADYINIDTSVIRLIWTLVVVFTGVVPGILVYVIMLFIIPTRHGG